jgi:arylsulfatase A
VLAHENHKSYKQMKYLFSNTIHLKIFLILSLSCLSICNAQNQKKPNFIVILTDDQSWVGTSFLADPDDPRSKSDYYQTPQMERLAKSGMRMTNGYAPAPFCSPTRKSILTGLTPAKHEYQKDRENWVNAFRKQMTIPKILKKADPNYVTAHFGKWDARYDDFTPEEMGYDYSDGLTSNNTGGGKKTLSKNGEEFPFKMGEAWPKAYDDPKLIFSLTQRSNDFMEEQTQKNKPFFIQISHYAVHLAITYSQKNFNRYSKLKNGQKHFVPEFAAMTEDMDEGIGMLLDKVASLGIADNTYIIFLSDNGGRTSIPIGPEQQVARNFPLRGGKGSMYEGGLRVPFIVSGPGVPQNSHTDVPVTGLDILPTVARLAGYEGTLPQILDGGNIERLIHNKKAAKVERNSPYLIFHQAANRKPTSAIRWGNYKLVKDWRFNKLELFDLSKDVEEKNDLSKKSPELVKKLNKALTQFLFEANAEIKQTEI